MYFFKFFFLTFFLRSANVAADVSVWLISTSSYIFEVSISTSLEYFDPTAVLYFSADGVLILKIISWHIGTSKSNSTEHGAKLIIWRGMVCPWPGFITVSYTQLDVYKRQPVYAAIPSVLIKNTILSPWSWYPITFSSSFNESSKNNFRITSLPNET